MGLVGDSNLTQSVLLRPTGSHAAGYTPTSTAYSNFATKCSNAGAALTGSDITNYGHLLDDLTTDGFFDGSGNALLHDALYIFAAPSSTVALLNLAASATTFDATANGSPNFSAYNGFLGVNASTTVFINTQFNAVTAGGKFAVNSCHIGAWNITNADDLTLGGVSNAGANESNIYPRLSNQAFFRANDGSGSGGNANSDSRGFFLANRSGASASQGYINGSLLASPNVAAGSLLNLTFYFLAVHDGLSGTVNGGGYRVACGSLGGSLNSTDQGNLYTRLRTYMTAVGVP